MTVSDNDNYTPVDTALHPTLLQSSGITVCFLNCNVMQSGINSPFFDESPEDGGGMSLRNTGKCMSHYTTS